jgi:hypothetical protein
MRKLLWVPVVACLLGGGLRADEDAVRAVVDRALKAHGGEKNLARLKRTQTTATGTLHGEEDKPITFVFTTDLPDRMRTVTTLPNKDEKFTLTQVLNAEQAWKSFNKKTREMKGPELTAARQALQAARVATLFYLKDKDNTLTALGPAKVGNRECVGLRVARKGFSDIDVYFDKETGLLRKLSFRSFEPGAKKEAEQVRLFTDYKEFDGVKLATRETLSIGGRPVFDLEVTGMRFLEQPDPALFAKP